MRRRSLVEYRVEELLLVLFLCEKKIPPAVHAVQTKQKEVHFLYISLTQSS